MTKRFNQRYSDFSIQINNFLQTVYDIISSVTRSRHALCSRGLAVKRNKFLFSRALYFGAKL